MNRKICPECQLETDERSLLCDCGHHFLDAMEVRGHDELRTIKWGKTKGRLKKFTFITGIAILGVAGILYWRGLSGAADRSIADVPAGIDTTPTPMAENLISSSGSTIPTNDAQYIVTTVSTGDTITVSSGNNELHRVRIYGIVSPKLDESFGNEARVFLSRQILGKSISLVSKKTTNEGLLMAEVYMNGINIGIEQVRAGLAQLAIDQSSQPDQNYFRPYLDAEFIAKSGRFGIWAGGTNGLPSLPGADIDGVASNPQVPYRSSRGLSKFRLTGMNSPFDPSNEPVELIRQEVPPSNDSTVSTEGRPAQQTAGPKNNVTAEAPVQTPADADLMKPHTNSTKVTTSRTYTRGSRGGCYYLSASRNRVYVDRSLCN